MPRKRTDSHSTERSGIDHETAVSEARVHVVTADGDVRPLATREAAPAMPTPVPAAPPRADATPSRAAAAPAPGITDPIESRIINQVQEGMRVFDAGGEELGRVDHIRMGDPDAATVDAVRPGEQGLLGAFFGDVEPDVPEPLRSRLLRSGYVKIDGKGWIDTDRYVTADAIGSVSGDTVTLTVSKDRVLTEM